MSSATEMMGTTPRNLLSKLSVEVDNSTIVSLHFASVFQAVIDQVTEDKQVSRQKERSKCSSATTNPIQDLEANNVNMDGVFKFTQAYHYENPEMFNAGIGPFPILPHQVDSHQSHNKTSVFDHINHLGNDYDAPITTETWKNNLIFTLMKTKTEEDYVEEVHPLFITSQVKSFIELNRVGFTKSVRSSTKLVTTPSKGRLHQNYLPNNFRIYAYLSNRLTPRATKEDLESVKNDLRSHLRDHIVWNVTPSGRICYRWKEVHNNGPQCRLNQAKMGVKVLQNSLLNMLTTINLPFSFVKVDGSDEPMDGVTASQYILSTMWNSTIMILIGGFTLAAALSKYNIAKVLSSYILAFCWYQAS
ncbi:hypothetical protein G9P44_005137 [Scheffersomyces stipitis]|nr:hypothetical protein G9P44_005137 [Scheffersomyces stipitis]